MTQDEIIEELSALALLWRAEIELRRKQPGRYVSHDLARIVCQLELLEERIEAENNIIELKDMMPHAPDYGDPPPGHPNPERQRLAVAQGL